jgi:hypothetical protein
VTWAGEAVAAIRKIVLLDERVTRLADRVGKLADSYAELDRRLLRIEAKFELLERLAAARSALPAKPAKSKRLKKKN